MTIQEYQILAARTCPDLGSKELNLLHMDMGVNTEIGEALDAIKKHIAYGKPLDKVNLQEELCGDVMWYLVNKARIEGEKLKSQNFVNRYNPEKYTANEFAKQLMDFIAKYNNQYYSNYGCIDRIYRLSIGIGLDFFQGLENNINKLKVRYPEKFTQANALNRNLDLERIELEK